MAGTFRVVAFSRPYQDARPKCKVGTTSSLGFNIWGFAPNRKLNIGLHPKPHCDKTKSPMPLSDLILGAPTQTPITQQPIQPAPAPPDVPKLLFTRGVKYPQAVAWFSVRSFWGHLWHLAASVIATDDIDSRAWMRPSAPETMTHKTLTVLGGKPDADSLTEGLDRDVWIDFIADTGDDSSVAEAVARMLFSTYEVDDPLHVGDKLLLPRGDMLLFGGDTAYPVATAFEIHNRIIVPYSRALEEVRDNKRRVLVGIPGNHDWYGGLDGFGRMFRARRGAIDEAGADKPNEVVRFAEIQHFVKWVEAFHVGHYVTKRSILPLRGYVTVQDASYFALRLAPGLDLWGADRQLRAVDFEQRAFFAGIREDGRGLVLCLADPVRAFLETNPAGQHILDALHLRLDDDGLLVLSGDTHHYSRERVGNSDHVTAGGGGAFLHPARMARSGMTPPVAEFPGPKACIALALQIPWQMARGRSGYLVHLGIGAIYAIGLGLDRWIGLSQLSIAVGTVLVTAFVCRLFAGFRNRALGIYPLATLAGLVMGFLPFLTHLLLGWALVKMGGRASYIMAIEHWVAIVIAAFGAAFVFGMYLTALTIFGIEQHQAFSVLAHPGYKHFVRLRVRRDGRHIDGWVLGKVDPLSASEPIVLVDQFTWTNEGLSTGAKSAVFRGEH